MQYVLPVPILRYAALGTHRRYFLRRISGYRRWPLAFRPLGEVRPFQPRVIDNPARGNDEREFCDQWKDLIRLLAEQALVRGAPHKRIHRPGGIGCAKLVESLYRTRLTEWGRDWRKRQKEFG